MDDGVGHIFSVFISHIYIYLYKYHISHSYVYTGYDIKQDT